MNDDIWLRDEIDSPCVKICVIHEGAGICIGCYRSRAEIAGWSRFTSLERQEITATLEARAPSLRGTRRPRRTPRKVSP